MRSETNTFALEITIGSVMILSFWIGVGILTKNITGDSFVAFGLGLVGYVISFSIILNIALKEFIAKES